jgi:hypothetical protein
MLKYIWQLPQHLLALCILLILKITKTPYFNNGKINGSTIYRVKNIKWGISLGSYIIISATRNHLTVLHEYGHSIQSLYFGPLYLLIIGLPSITMNILSIVMFYLGNRTVADNYYKRFPEKWADILGGVKR